jgi:hypothetical protein
MEIRSRRPLSTTERIVATFGPACRLQMCNHSRDLRGDSRATRSESPRAIDAMLTWSGHRRQSGEQARSLMANQGIRSDGVASDYFFS